MPNEVSILVNAQDNASKTLDSISGKAKLAFVGLGAAAAGFATKSLMAFSDFERGMNEVFTLLPGISGDAMKEMEGQVKDFSTEFGVLPNQAIPALYQALSAGVPPNNVFEFLETAQKAAKGGVTDLETAVDGITSVVNAYGDETISASKASDLMFTAVRLGKTDFEQLSSSLFNVVPTAASLGIEFKEVTAALATLTAQGTPTSVATTQLRQLFVETTKSGTKLSDAIKEMAGVSMGELIARGDSVTDVLQELRGGMPDQEFRDLFGSVEALNAALGITGPNVETMWGNMYEMGQSAGATDAAFKQMDQGLGPIFDRLKARFQVVMIEVGQKLAPVLIKIIDFLEDNLPKVAGFFGDVADAVRPFVDALVRLGRDFIDAYGQRIKDTLQQIVDFAGKEAAIGAAAGVVTLLAIALAAMAVSAIAAAAPFIAIVAAAAALGAGIALLITHWDDLKERLPILQDFEEFAEKAFGAVAEFVQEKLIPAIEAITAFLTDDFIPAIKEAASWFQDNILPAIENVAEFLIGGFTVAFDTAKGVIEAFVGFFKRSWDELGDIVLAALRAVKEAIEAGLEVARQVVKTVLALLRGDWSAAWEEFKGIFQEVWEGMQEVLKAQIDLIVTTIKNAPALILSALQLFHDAGKSLLQGLWNGVSYIWTNTVSPFFTGMAQAILDDIGDLLTTLEQTGKDLIQGLWDGITFVFDLVRMWFLDLPRKIVDAIGDTYTVLLDAGKALVTGFFDGIKGTFEAGFGAIRDKLDPRNWDIPGLSPLMPAMEHAGAMAGARFAIGLGTALNIGILQAKAVAEKALSEAFGDPGLQADGGPLSPGAEGVDIINPYAHPELYGFGSDAFSKRNPDLRALAALGIANPAQLAMLAQAEAMRGSTSGEWFRSLTTEPTYMPGMGAGGSEEWLLAQYQQKALNLNITIEGKDLAALVDAIHVEQGRSL